jgi:HK97 family phage prohead protease
MRRNEGAADERKFVDATIADVSADGTFEGYASLFGKVDLGCDIVERGAFAASLARRGAAGVRMLFQHDPAAPIGTWTDLSEDARGLFVRGRLALGAPKAREVHALMKQGALDGLSIGFRAVRARADAKSGIRRILEVDLWEISVVTFPMLPEARVGTVKARRRLAPLSSAPLIDTIQRATSMLKKGTI